MTALLILLAAVSGGRAAAEAATPTPAPAPPVAILLAKPEGGPPPQGGSLAEVAKRIKLKLPANQPRVITNESVKQLAEGVELTMSAPAAGGTGAVGAPAGASEESKKAHWQQRYRTAIQRVRSLETEVKALEVKAAELEREFYAHDDPVYRDSTIKPNWDKTLARLTNARQELEEARRQPDEVLNAARRDGALPGWFRGLDAEAASAAPSPAAASGKPAGKATPAQPRIVKPVGPS